MIAAGALLLLLSFLVFDSCGHCCLKKAMQRSFQICHFVFHRKKKAEYECGKL